MSMQAHLELEYLFLCLCSMKTKHSFTLPQASNEGKFQYFINSFWPMSELQENKTLFSSFGCFSCEKQPLVMSENTLDSLLSFSPHGCQFFVFFFKEVGNTSSHCF